jgi:hypothetical protein
MLLFGRRSERSIRRRFLFVKGYLAKKRQFVKLLAGA